MLGLLYRTCVLWQSVMQRCFIVAYLATEQEDSGAGLGGGGCGAGGGGGVIRAGGAGAQDATHQPSPLTDSPPQQDHISVVMTSRILADPLCHTS